MEGINRECGDCSACCDGNLVATILSNKMGDGKPCVFLVDKKCVVYDNRPEVCRNYHCAWRQGLFDEDLKPNISNVMISVENETPQKQFLRVIELGENVSEETYVKIKEFTDKHNTYFVKAPYKKTIPIKAIS